MQNSVRECAPVSLEISSSFLLRKISSFPNSNPFFSPNITTITIFLPARFSVPALRWNFSNSPNLSTRIFPSAVSFVLQVPNGKYLVAILHSIGYGIFCFFGVRGWGVGLEVGKKNERWTGNRIRKKKNLGGGLGVWLRRLEGVCGLGREKWMDERVEIWRRKLSFSKRKRVDGLRLGRLSRWDCITVFVRFWKLIL